jgi:hypothetical protein
MAFRVPILVSRVPILVFRVPISVFRVPILVFRVPVFVRGSWFKEIAREIREKRESRFESPAVNKRSKNRNHEFIRINTNKTDQFEKPESHCRMQNTWYQK